MKKNIIISFIAGAILFGTAGVFAGQYVATENPFLIQLNGNSVNMQGYNIDGSTYFKLRDIADVVGGFDVGFENSTIQIAKNGYIYNNSFAGNFDNYIGRYYKPIPDDSRYWFGYELDINAIDDNTVAFEYQHPKPGQALYYTASPATFVDDHIAIATGTCTRGGEQDNPDATTDVQYTLDFSGDTVSIRVYHIGWDSSVDTNFNINTDLRSNYDLYD